MKKKKKQAKGETAKERKEKTSSALRPGLCLRRPLSHRPRRPGPRGAQSDKLPASTRPATELAAAARRDGTRPYKARSEKNYETEEGPISRIFFENGRALKTTNLFFVQEFCVLKIRKD